MKRLITWLSNLFELYPNFKYENERSKPRYTLIRSSNPTKLMCYRTRWKYRHSDPNYKGLIFMGYIDR